MPKQTQEERVQELLATLEKGVKEFNYTPEQYKSILKMQALMPHYSFRNIMIARAQLPNASFLAGFNRWKELGRSVRKGERALRILAPKIVKERNKKGELKDTCVGFITIPIFDVSQTEGDALPIDSITAIKVEGDCPEARNIIRVVTKMADQDNCPITYGDTGSANGYYQVMAHAIKISDTLSINHQAEVLVHELVHSRVDCLANRKRTTVGEREVVAEGTAFIVCQYFGLDTSDYSFQYVKGWSKDSDNSILEYGEKIATTSSRLIKEFEKLSMSVESLQTA